MNSNTSLIKSMISEDFLKSEIIIQAFKKIDRKDFVLKDFKDLAYYNFPISIWFWQTISQPSTVAFMLELLSPQLWDNILDIGSWSWWTTALLSVIVWEKWSVKWYDIIPELVNFWNSNLSKYNLSNASISLWKRNFSNIIWVYDKILVSASAENVPIELIKKLKIGGVIVIPIKNSIVKITKIDTSWKYSLEEFFWFSFVPLITE